MNNIRPSNYSRIRSLSLHLHMPQYYKESGLLFTFPDNWWVIKLDEHRFYRYVSGRGYKGVDFIIIDDSGKLLLIEVKNYSNRFPADGILPITALLGNPMAYANKYIGKYEDTFSLIRINSSILFPEIMVSKNSNSYIDKVV